MSEETVVRAQAQAHLLPHFGSNDQNLWMPLGAVT